MKQYLFSVKYTTTEDLRPGTVRLMEQHQLLTVLAKDRESAELFIRHGMRAADLLDSPHSVELISESIL